MKCWMCHNSKAAPVLHGDGFHYHGRQRCKAKKWRIAVYYRPHRITGLLMPRSRVVAIA